jgi:hypothetical protein
VTSQAAVAATLSVAATVNRIATFIGPCDR